MGLLACDRAAAPVDATVSDAETRDVVADDHRDAAAEGAPRDRVIPADARDATAADSMDAGDDVRDDVTALDASRRADAAELASDASPDDVSIGADSSSVDIAVDATFEEMTPTLDASGPPPVYSAVDVVASRVFAGAQCTFVTASDGTLWGWGDNQGFLQPSDKYYADGDIRMRPQRVDGVLHVREMYLSFDSARAPCALAGGPLSGTVYCWGAGPYSVLGLPWHYTWDEWRFPHRMGSVSDVSHLHYSDVIRSDGSLWRIGARDDLWSMYPDYAGQWVQGAAPGVIRTRDGLLIKPYLSSYMDTTPQRISGIVDIAGGPDFTCILLETGRLMCWGTNTVAQTGTGYEGTEVCHWAVRDSPTSSHTEHVMCVRRPTLVPGLTDVVKVALGESRGCALRRDGSVWCWGWNVPLRDGRGELGDGRPAAEEHCIPYDVVDGGVVPEPSRAVTCRRAPTRVVGIDDAIDISVGVDFQCAVRATGQVLCWGFNGYGQLGTGDTMARALPTPVRWY